VIYANDNFSEWKQDFRQQVAQCVQDGGPAARIAMLSPCRPLFRAQAQALCLPGQPLPILLAKLGVRRLWLSG
jgi:ribosomal protein S14